MIFLGGASKRFQECPSSSEGLLVWVVATSEGSGHSRCNKQISTQAYKPVCLPRVDVLQAKTQVKNICQCKRVPFSLCWPRAAPSRANPLVNEMLSLMSSQEHTHDGQVVRAPCCAKGVTLTHRRIRP